MVKRVPIVFFFFFSCCFTWAQEVPKAYAYLLKNAVSAKNKALPHYLVRREWVDNLATDVVIKRQLDADFIIIQPVKDKIHQENTSKWTPVNALWKLQDISLIQEKKNTVVWIKVEDGTSFNFKFKFKRAGARYLRAKLSSKQIKALIEYNEVYYIGYEASVVQDETRVLDLNLIPNRFNKVHEYFPLLTGGSIVVGLKENQPKTTDIDLLDRVVLSDFASEEQSNHATEMATIIAGSGNSFVNGKGVAPSTSLISTGYEQILPENAAFYLQNNIEVQNHSYGTTIESFYGVASEAYDLNSNENTNLLHVISSGNNGAASATSGKYAGLAGWSNFTGNFKNSKNTLLVGAADTTGNTLVFSSKGPTFDGRIKPEVVAYSTAGTSNSAALVSGLATLLKEAYTKKYSEIAASALIKAVIINSSDDIYTVGPDYSTGFGNVNAFQALKGLDSNNFYEGDISDNQVVEWPVEVPVGTKELKITLVWNDPAARANDNVILVNDLNGELIGPNWSVWKPWVLQTEADVAGLSSPATRGIDNRNNVEQISVQDPEPGTYVFKISVADMVGTNQAFYVAKQLIKKDTLIWDHPIANSNFPYDGETGSYFRWYSGYDEEVEGNLEISTDGGQSWEMLFSGIALNQKQLRWQNVEHAGTAKVRMWVNGIAYESELFSISKTLSIQVAYQCSDSTLLYWKEDPNALSYQVDQLVASEFQKIGNTPDTLFRIPTKDSESYFKVTPLYSNGMSGIGSYASQPASLKVGCYYSTFYAFKNKRLINVNADFSTLFEVKEVVLEKNIGGNFVPLQTYTGIESFSYEDRTPIEGINQYRLKIIRNNNVTVYSDVTETMYYYKTVGVVYPNLVIPNADIQIRAGGPMDRPSYFYVHAATGQLLFESRFYESQKLKLPTFLTRGMYFYTIKNDVGTSSGRLVVH